ncbi:hypothetical protein TH25_24165 [Thalassospira profundimaris]|uniref:Uncharacterized protein n=1 Tax=Thalassospira profundimaris TaxID=502049 RepID=A0A367WHN2_9PROT|nr:hypothetical protein TH25_24165 [Thalassospira profundimaris]
MSKPSPEAIFQARARLDEAQDVFCEDCGPALIFALQSGETTLSLDMPTLLQCLYVAEQKTLIPRLGADWWNSVIVHYNMGSALRDFINDQPHHSCCNVENCPVPGQARVTGFCNEKSHGNK